MGIARLSRSYLSLSKGSRAPDEEKGTQGDGENASYSPRIREVVFSETGLPVYGFLLGTYLFSGTYQEAATAYASLGYFMSQFVVFL